MLKTILIVDDETVVVDISKRRLMQKGYAVLCAHNGEEALEVLRNGKVDLIVLDVEMPGMNGYTFMSERKNIPDAADVPVLVVTAYPNMEPIFQRQGIKMYLLKPLQFSEFTAKIKEIIGEP
ncbi:MAG: response regulator [Candidatus Omnitrophota bacterium]